MKRILFAFCCAILLASSLPAAKTLDMWVVDTEGGKSVLLLSPSGQSMLIDTGFPGNNDRDANRILEACKAAGVTKIDVLITTHYDMDHVNNTPAVVGRIPVALFVDHGPAAVTDRGTTAAVKAYDELWAKAKHLVVKPGDKIPFKDVDIVVLTSAGQSIKTPLKGAGKPNPDCATTQPKTWGRTNEDNSENGNSVGMLFTFGKFRMADFGDLTWNREIQLMCPNNPIGTVDLFMVSHHGNNISNSPALINPLHARVSVMDNGARKIGAAEVMKTLKAAPGMQAVYLSHWSANAPNDNPPDEFIANLQSSPDGKWIKISADKNGTIAVTNARTGESKTYKR
ncbi:MAG: MBL fold metallo-hydrolase [Acidobacteriia bacterium]|nr:MBL fold metallo-hydrolase [Terriglobia bacterium]